MAKLTEVIYSVDLNESDFVELTESKPRLRIQQDKKEEFPVEALVKGWEARFWIDIHLLSNLC